MRYNYLDGDNHVPIIRESKEPMELLLLIGALGLIIGLLSWICDAILKIIELLKGMSK